MGTNEANCPVCGGTGQHPDWGEKSCAHCGSTIEYRFDWDHIPEYCKTCKQPCHTSCKGCGTSIEYKIYWSNIPEYCQTCKQWKTKYCKHCGTSIQYKSYWDNIPDYCQNCKGWQEKACATSGCTELVRYKFSWNNPPEYCDTCKKLGGRHRDPWKDPRNRIEEWVDRDGQYNLKIVTGPDAGRHKYYDHKNFRGGETGKERF